MAEIVAIGGGVAGLATGMLLAGDGHDVRLLERDPQPPPPDPDDAWAAWERRGVNQFRMVHYFLARFRQVLDAEQPAVARALDDAGAPRINPVTGAPAEVTGGLRHGDDI